MDCFHRGASEVLLWLADVANGVFYRIIMLDYTVYSSYTLLNVQDNSQRYSELTTKNRTTDIIAIV